MLPIPCSVVYGPHWTRKRYAWHCNRCYVGSDRCGTYYEAQTSAREHARSHWLMRAVYQEP